MPEVTNISPITAKNMNAFHKLDADIAEAIKKAKDCDVPQGLIVAVLHGHSTKETIEMIS